uniref:Uncharacterized protein n=1 Tax=Rhizophora mucronata TaxID=61149 RepID=A0A2P2NJA5_RHIMU
MVVENLCSKAEMIHAIVQGNGPNMPHSGATDLKNAEEVHTNFVRRQGDKLIACLREVVDIHNQFPHLVQAFD